MKANPDREVVARKMWDLELADGIPDIQRHVGYHLAVVVVLLGQPTDHHISVAYRLHLVHVVFIDGGVEQADQGRTK